MSSNPSPPPQSTAPNTSKPVTVHHWSRGLRLSVPVAMGYVPAGIAFGVLAVVAGLPIWATVLMSVLLYAGAAQYAALPMLSGLLPISSIATNIAAINLRHLFYALPILKQLPSQYAARIYCLFALTDEAYSVLTYVPSQSRTEVMLPVSLFLQLWWILGTLLGISLGELLSGIPHLDFALICLFAILAYEQFSLIRRSFPILLAGVCWLGVLWLDPTWRLLAAIALCAVLILAKHAYSVHRSVHHSAPKGGA